MVRVNVTHTIATLVKLNEFFEVVETTIDFEGEKTKEQIESMFKGCKVKTMQVVTDTYKISLEDLIMLSRIIWNRISWNRIFKKRKGDKKIC